MKVVPRLSQCCHLEKVVMEEKGEQERKEKKGDVHDPSLLSVLANESGNRVLCPSIRSSTNYMNVHLQACRLPTEPTDHHLLCSFFAIYHKRYAHSMFARTFLHPRALLKLSFRCTTRETTYRILYGTKPQFFSTVNPNSRLITR